MKRISLAAISGLLMMTAATLPVMAADASTQVRVALLDMTSLFPGGAAGYGMMYPGMMGRGYMGPGMMGQGYVGRGYMGQGYMGQGYMGPGMMGYGMMGQGMMGGMMSIRIDQASVKAGTIKFDVTNWSRSVVHEMLIVSVDNPNTPLPYDYAQARVPEDQVKAMGEVADLEPSASKSMEVTLSPGAYLLICNVPGHYAAGMVASITVTQ